MKIRFMNEHDDRYAISHVYEASWKSAYKDIVPQAYLDSIPEGHWVTVLDDPAWHTLIMLDGEKVVGTSSYCSSRFLDMNGWGEIISVYLLPDYCGKGYGKQLLQSAIDGLVQMGYEDIFLWVLEDNIRARRFYQSYGFEHSHVFLDYDIGGKKLREVQYVYRIKCEQRK